MRQRARTIGLVALLTSLAPASPAHAGNNVVAIHGFGRMNPGTPCPPAGCFIDGYYAMAVFAGQDASGTATCTFAGTDNFPGGATVVAGSGSGTINCSGGVTANGTITFSRTGVVIDVSGSITVNGLTCTVDVTLAFVPTTTPPITNFEVDGGGTVTC